MKGPPEVEETWRRLGTVDVSGLDRAGCARHMRDLKRVRAWLDAAELEVVARQKALADVGEAEPAELATQRNSGRSSRASRAVSDREAICEAVPGLGDALAAGDTTSEHVDVISRVAARLDDELRADFLSRGETLIAEATRMSVDAFARHCRRLAKDLIARRPESAEEELERQRTSSSIRRWSDLSTGMCHMHVEMDPIRAAVLDAALDAAMGRVRAHHQDSGRRPTSFGDLQVDALIDALRHGVGRGVPEIAVLISWETLAGDAVDAGLCLERGDGPPTVCETVDGVELTPDHVRRLTCDAEVYPVVLGTDGIVRDHGRLRRTASADQRRELAAMHSTCAHPDCSVAFSATRAHHVRHWTVHRGRTDLDNLLPLCETHHHLVHEGRWRLEMTPDRYVTWRLPNGSIYHEGSAIDRLAA